MASAYEYTGSGTGERQGLSGLDSTLTYVSTLDTPTDDPAGPVKAVMPIGSKHPRPAFSGLVVFDYIPRRMQNPLSWIVDVVFAPQYAPEFGGWRVEIEGSSEIEHITRDLDGKLIGMKYYRPAEDEETPTHYCALAKPVNGSTNLLLVETEAVKPSGHDSMGGVTTLTLVRTLPNMTMATMRNLDNRKAHINDAAFRQWPKHTLLFHSYSIRETTGFNAGQRLSGLVYPCRLSFLVKLDGWETIERYSTWIDDEGNESFIWKSYDGPPPEDDAPVSDTFRVQPETNFEAMLAMLMR